MADTPICNISGYTPKTDIRSPTKYDTVNSTIVPDKQLQECCKGEVNVYTWHSFGGR